MALKRLRWLIWDLIQLYQLSYYGLKRLRGVNLVTIALLKFDLNENELRINYFFYKSYPSQQPRQFHPSNISFLEAS